MYYNLGFVVTSLHSEITTKNYGNVENIYKILPYWNLKKCAYCLSNFVMNSILNWHPASSIENGFYIHQHKSREDFTEHDESKNLNLNWFFDWRLSCCLVMLNLFHNCAIISSDIEKDWFQNRKKRKKQCLRLFNSQIQTLIKW